MKSVAYVVPSYGPDPEAGPVHYHLRYESRQGPWIGPGLGLFRSISDAVQWGECNGYEVKRPGFYVVGQVPLSPELLESFRLDVKPVGRPSDVLAGIRAAVLAGEAF